MGSKYKIWQPLWHGMPNNILEISGIIKNNRNFFPVSDLSYGDHGLEEAVAKIFHAIEENKKIAFYADYDVDGTMSLVSWIWFLKELGYKNYTYYIPCRFKEGYGLNMEAVKLLVETRKAEMVITMDTGITANEEASYCKSKGIEFICTDHHTIQKDKMPDCTIVNPKMHPEKEFQELCGCGITFVVLRKLASKLPVNPSLWNDLLALTGIATICDIVPLNSGVNHTLAKKGIESLCKSNREVFKKLLKACQSEGDADESDIGFRLGPRINAVGRLEHAESVVEAFITENPDNLIQLMGTLNEKRKAIQSDIVDSALLKAQEFSDDPILFLGDKSWHQGVVGICASKIKDTFWKPTWLFQISPDGICKGSARSIEGFDATLAMMEACSDLFLKFGGHKAAAGFSFELKNLAAIRKALIFYASELKDNDPSLWDSKITYDCVIDFKYCKLDSIRVLDDLRPFGHHFEKPRFLLEGMVDSIQYYKDKLTKKNKHTALTLTGENSSKPHKVMYFNEVFEGVSPGKHVKTIVTLEKNNFRGNTYVNLIGSDIDF